MGPSTTATVTGGGAPVEATSAKRKRGRPRKYGTPELALAAKKTATSASVAASRERKEQHQAGSSSTTSSFSGSSSKKSQHVLGKGFLTLLWFVCELLNLKMWFNSLKGFVFSGLKHLSILRVLFFIAGTAGHGFTPHVITVAAGELRVPFILGLYSDEQHYVVEFKINSLQDVGQKIIQFLQQSTREMCILSASGSVMNVSLRQPANSGGNISYEPHNGPSTPLVLRIDFCGVKWCYSVKLSTAALRKIRLISWVVGQAGKDVSIGRFEIIYLSGSYIRTDMGGRAGGLSVCLSDSNGQIIGGGVGGPLKAAGPVQVIVGTFVLDNKKDGSGKGDASGSKLPSPVKASVPSFGFHLPVESSVRNPARGNDDLLTVGGGNPFTMQPSTMHLLSARTMDWRSSPDVRTSAGYDFTGRTGHGGSQSPVNGGYD
ncbi:hypothetical protein POTOM_057929 [Populus tomentosa]|uniref:AT-hook motif nuclear-localized protein n=1 Tax=Populus tomentosa TaxID=118781 RepID=A0A8X7XWU9_POPTO|nr:hypothetical protein POTOM_057929 [Populus tomentosa]